jgi:ABC-type polar amino acid transport system ATPase subunit
MVQEVEKNTATLMHYGMAMVVTHHHCGVASTAGYIIQRCDVGV